MRLGTASARPGCRTRARLGMRVRSLLAPVRHAAHELDVLEVGPVELEGLRGGPRCRALEGGGGVHVEQRPRATEYGIAGIAMAADRFADRIGQAPAVQQPR